MESILSAVFWIVNLFNARSNDPVFAEFKHARRAMIICMVGLFIFLALANAFAPDGPIDVNKTALLFEQMHYLFRNVFALVALGFLFGMIWFAIRTLHIYLF
jgi:hypothetical protein